MSILHTVTFCILIDQLVPRLLLQKGLYYACAPDTRCIFDGRLCLRVKTENRHFFLYI